MSNRMGVIVRSVIDWYADTIDAVSDNLLTEENARALVEIAEDIVLSNKAMLLGCLTSFAKSVKHCERQIKEFTETLENEVASTHVLMSFVEDLEEATKNIV